MKGTNRSIQLILGKLLAISIYWFLQYINPERPFIGPTFQFLVSLFTFSNVLDNWVILRLKRARDRSFTKRKYLVALGVVTLWAFGAPLIAVTQMYIHAPRPEDQAATFLIYLLPAILVLGGYGWIALSKYFKDPFLFLGRYCAMIQIMLLPLVLSTTIVVSGRSLTLFELTLTNPSDSLWIYLYMFSSIVLIVVYLTPVGRTLWGARFSAALAVTNVLVCVPLSGQIENLWDTVIPHAFRIALILMLTGLIPQFYWPAIASNRAQQESVEDNINEL